MGIKSIQISELEPLARRIWYAGASNDACFSWFEKHASFEAMGFADDSLEFQMLSEEWIQAGDYEVNISYSLGGIPGVIRVRRSPVWRYRIGAIVRFAYGGKDPLRVPERTLHDELPEYTVQSRSLNIFHDSFGGYYCAEHNVVRGYLWWYDDWKFYPERHPRKKLTRWQVGVARFRGEPCFPDGEAVGPPRCERVSSPTRAGGRACP